MAFQIPNALIPCYVIQMNNTIFIEGDQIQGRILEIPCKNDFIDDPNYWAVPIKDAGIFTTIEYIPVALSPTPPTFDSFTVFRVRDKLSGYTWWVFGTQQNFVSSCSTCCGAGTIPMPNTAVGGIVIPIAPCDTMDILNTAGVPYSITALPDLVGSETYFPYGSYNNVALPAASGSGYPDTTTLLAFLNTSWKNVGSPNANFTWTLSADSITLTATGGFLSDSLCVVISSVGPSV